VQATNWRAEQAIRPAVVTRKVWGGNRTWAGAGAWKVLASVLRTASQQGRGSRPRARTTSPSSTTRST
jgi:transposase